MYGQYDCQYRAQLAAGCMGLLGCGSLVDAAEDVSRHPHSTQRSQLGWAESMDRRKDGHPRPEHAAKEGWAGLMGLQGLQGLDGLQGPAPQPSHRRGTAAGCTVLRSRRSRLGRAAGRWHRAGRGSLGRTGARWGGRDEARFRSHRLGCECTQATKAAVHARQVEVGGQHLQD